MSQADGSTDRSSGTPRAQQQNHSTTNGAHPCLQVGEWRNMCFESARQRHVCRDRTLQRCGQLEPRNLVLGVNGRIGALCDCFRRSASECTRGLPAFTRPEKDTVALELGSAVALVLELADQCNIDLPLALLRKIQLNDRKYPASLVRGSASKYDAYHHHTGYTKDSKQVTTEGFDGQAHLEGHADKEWTILTFQDLRVRLSHFAQDRGWDKFHTPRNICLALSGEAGELCELFQWKDEDTCSAGLPGWTSEARDKVAQEISDVCIYLCRLSDLCGIDLPVALQDMTSI
ncbi:unnamed protein product [Ascophyllum nodosum]